MIETLPTMPIKFVTAEEEYQKNKDLKREDIIALQEWLTTQIHLPTVSEFQIILFHHSCFYDMEKTKLCMESYFTQRKRNPQIFSNRDPFDDGVQQVLNTFAIHPMPKKTPKGYSVIYNKLKDLDYRNYNCINHMKYLDMSCSLMLHQQGTSEGNVFVFDMKNMTLRHIFKLNVFTCKIYSQFLQDSLPFRLKEIHLVNGGAVVGRLLGFLKMVMTKYLYELLHCHDDLETLYEYVQKEYLPEDVGGYCDSVDSTASSVVKNIEDNKDFFLKEEELIADESKREKGAGWLGFWK